MAECAFLLKLDDLFVWSLLRCMGTLQGFSVDVQRRTTLAQFDVGTRSDGCGCRTLHTTVELQGL